MGLLWTRAKRHDIAQAFVDRCPPSQPLAKLPTCPASELSAPTLFTDANVSGFRDTWHEVKAKEPLSLCAVGTFGEG